MGPPSNARRKSSGGSETRTSGSIISAHLREDVRGKGSTKRPTRPQNAQRSRMPDGSRDRTRNGTSVGIVTAFPLSDGDRDLIDWEP